MRLAVAILAGVIVAGTARTEVKEERMMPPQSGAADCSTFFPYSPDPNHMWNRLQRALIVRRGPDGTFWGCDEVDPLLWSDTKYVLTGEANTRATQALDEFIETHAARLVSDPLKRALLQRNLWAVFLWLTGVACHSGPGVMSFTTYSRSHAVAPGDPMFVSIHRGDEGQELAKQLSALIHVASWRKLQALTAPPR